MPTSSLALAELLITVPELNRILCVLQCGYEVDIQCDREGCWTVHFIVENRKYTLATARGTRRCWRQLEPVLAFVKRECQACQQIRLHTSSWTLSSDWKPNERTFHPVPWRAKSERIQ